MDYYYQDELGHATISTKSRRMLIVEINLPPALLEKMQSALNEHDEIFIEMGGTSRKVSEREARRMIRSAFDLSGTSSLSGTSTDW